jgi:hypothetical protein
MNYFSSFAIVAIAVVLIFAGGYESGKSAERERMNELVIKEQINHAKSLAEATNSLTLASSEYDRIKSDRDSLSRRLLQYTRGGSKGSATGACEARVARLENMVEQLHELVEACDGGWHGCAARKDALSEAVK